MDIQDEFGYKVDTNKFEYPEQQLANQYIEENDIVLELGARYGSVSCVINHKLNKKTNQVSVEPDQRVWNALERNKKVNNSNFHILKGFISRKKLGLTLLHSHNGYGTTSIEVENTNIKSYTLEEVQKQYNLRFNVLVADCEGFLEIFLDENQHIYDQLRIILFEADYPDKCNYEKIRNTLKEKGFVCILEGHQNIWNK